MTFPLHHRSTFHSFLVLLSFSFGSTFLACGGGDEQPTEPDEPVPEVTTVEVTPDSARLTALEASQDFEAIGRDQNGNRISGVSFQWRSSDDSVAAVDNEGTALAKANGSATIEAEASGVTGTANLIVQQEVAELEVEPDSAELDSVGDTVRFRVAATDRNGRRVSGGKPTWSSSNPAVATLDSTGLATAQSEGRAEISAEIDSTTGRGVLFVDPLVPLPTPISKTPPPRFWSVAVWDTQEERVLVYGGQARRPHNDVWAYDPEAGTWSRIDDSGPIRRMSAAVWDRSNQRMLVFGGNAGNPLWRLGEGLQNDLLSFAGTWRELSPSGGLPDARDLHATTWNRRDNRLLLFGGKRGDKTDNLNDLWTYRPEENRWDELTPDGAQPAPRHGHSVVWSDRSTSMLVFGGWDFDNEGRFSDLWRYSPSDNRWTQLDSEAPLTGRFRHSAVWDAASDQMLVFGGCCVPGMFDDLWSYQPDSDSWTELKPGVPRPSGRQKHTAVWDPIHEAMIVYGGSSGQCFFHNDLWAYVPRNDEWISLSPAPRATIGRMEHDAAWAAGKAYIFGGCQGSSATNHTLEFDPASRSLTVVEPHGSSPAGRKEHSLVAAPSDSVLLMFAGQGDDGRFNDLWQFDVTDQGWTELTPGGSLPAPRFDHAAVWAPGRQQMLVFGGMDNSRFYGDLWAYSPNDGNWTKLSSDSRGPGRRSDAEAVWDPVREQMIVHGGWWLDLGSGGAKDEFNETWAYRPDSDEWVKLNDGGNNAPGFRQEFTLTWDAHEEQVLLFGGFAFQTDDLLEDELWSLDPESGSWTELQPPSPRPSRRSDHKAVWNPKNAEMLVLGGVGGDQGRFLNQVWSYQSQANRWNQIYP